LCEEDFWAQYHRYSRYRRLTDHFVRWQGDRDAAWLRRVHPRLEALVRHASAEATRMDLVFGALAVGRSMGRFASLEQESRPQRVGQLAE
jgi:hypothetical protein